MSLRDVFERMFVGHTVSPRAMLNGPKGGSLLVSYICSCPSVLDGTKKPEVQMIPSEPPMEAGQIKETNYGEDAIMDNIIEMYRYNNMKTS